MINNMAGAVFRPAPAFQLGYNQKGRPIACLFARFLVN
jgi:hypothetical protein